MLCSALRPRDGHADRGAAAITKLGGIAMARYRCRTCGQEKTFVYDPDRYTCPICDSIDVQFVIRIEELPRGRSNETAWGRGTGEKE
jgi:rubrerythrin